MLKGLCPKPVFSVPCRVTAHRVKCWPNGSALLKVPFSYSIHLLFVKHLKPSKCSLYRIPTSLQTVRLLTKSLFCSRVNGGGLERLVFSNSQKDIYIFFFPLEKESGGGLWGFYYLEHVFYMSKNKKVKRCRGTTNFSLLLLQS